MFWYFSNWYSHPCLSWLNAGLKYESINNLPLMGCCENSVGRLQPSKFRWNLAFSMFSGYYLMKGTSREEKDSFWVLEGLTGKERGLRRWEMGQVGLLVMTEVERIVQHARISPVMPCGELVADIWQLLLMWWPRVSKSLLRIPVALGHLLMAWWPTGV